jgi:hypothetical protein
VEAQKSPKKKESKKENETEKRNKKKEKKHRICSSKQELRLPLPLPNPLPKKRRKEQIRRISSSRDAIRESYGKRKRKLSPGVNARHEREMFKQEKKEKGSSYESSGC